MEIKIIKDSIDDKYLIEYDYNRGTRMGALFGSATVKIPFITKEKRIVNSEEELRKFLQEVEIV